MKTSNHKEITNIVCDYFGQDKSEVFKPSRDKFLILTRQVNCYMLKKYTRLSDKEIGQGTAFKEFNMTQSRSNIYTSWKKIEYLLTTYKSLIKNCEDIDKLIATYIVEDDIEYMKVVLIKDIRSACSFKELLSKTKNYPNLITNINEMKNEPNS